MYQTRANRRLHDEQKQQEKYCMQRMDDAQQRVQEKCAITADYNYHLQNNEIYNPQGTYLWINPQSMPTVFDDQPACQEFKPTNAMYVKEQRERINSRRHCHIHASGDTRFADDDTHLPWHDCGIYAEYDAYDDMMNLGPREQPVAYPSNTHNLPDIEPFSAAEEAFVYGLLSVSPRHQRCGE